MGQVMAFLTVEKKLKIICYISWKIDVFKFDILFYIDIFSVAFGKEHVQLGLVSKIARILRIVVQTVANLAV